MAIRAVIPNVSPAQGLHETIMEFLLCPSETQTARVLALLDEYDHRNGKAS